MPTTNTTLTTADRERLAAAVQAIAARCDGAHSLDGQGFDGQDTIGGKALAAVPAADWTPDLDAFGWYLARKYRQQVEAYIGSDPTADIPCPSEDFNRREVYGARRRAERREAAAAMRGVFMLDARTVAVEAPYNAELVAALRGVPTRRWNAAEKLNVFSAQRAADVVAIGRRFDLTIAPELDADTPATEADLPTAVIDADDAGRLTLTFDYDELMIARVRELRGAAFDRRNGRWVCDPVPEALALRGFHVTAEAQQLVSDTLDAATAALAASTALDADVDVPGLARPLLPYQRAGVAYAVAKRRTLIADPVGLGKTAQALAAVHLDGALPAVVVCPNSVKRNWPREVVKFFPGTTTYVLDGTRSEPLPEADIYVVNYDILAGRVADLEAVAPKAVIADESHLVKTPGAKRSKALDALATDVRNRDGMVLLLSATPVLNRAEELVQQLKVMGHLSTFGGKYRFLNRYAHAESNGYGTKYHGVKNAAELHTRLRELCMIRRDKAEVLPELPPVRNAETVLTISPAARREYERVERDVISYIGELAAKAAEELGEDPQSAAVAARLRAQAAEQLVTLGTLRQAAAMAKLDAAVEWVRTFLDSGAKLVLFATHVKVVERLAAEFGDAAVKIRGGVSAEDRMVAVDRFQNDDSVRLIVCNLAAAREGLTLTAASDVAFVELDWTPAAHDQGVGRVYGRVNDAHGATAHFLLAERTIDEDMVELLAEKREVVGSITDGTADSDDAGSIAGDLMVRLAGRA